MLVNARRVNQENMPPLVHSSALFVIATRMVIATNAILPLVSQQFVFAVKENNLILQIS